MNSSAFKDNYKHNIERRRKFSLPGYKSLTDVGFDGEYVTPTQIEACSETGICLVSHNWFDVKSVEEYSLNPKKYQSLKEKGYDELIPFNRVLDRVLDKVGILREDTYMTQVFHLLPASQKETPSEEDVWKSFKAITQYEIQGRKVVALGKAAKTACIKFGIQNFAGYAHAASPSWGFRQGIPDDEYATKIANAINNVLFDNKIYSFYGASGNQYEYCLPKDPNTIPAVAGNYMLAILQNNEWQVLYVGESEDLRNRLVNNQHEKMTNATVIMHPDTVHILYDANQWDREKRMDAERDLIRSESPPLNFQHSTQNNKDTQQKTKQERIDSLVEWFRENYEDPAHRLPYNTREGGYQWIYGGPYDANEELGGRFPEESEEIIEAAVEEIQSDGIFDWAPAPKPEDYDYGDEEPLDNSDSEVIHKVIRNRLNAVQNATPLAESVKWNSSIQKAHITPVPVNNIVLWEGNLERLHDEISDIKDNDRLSNTHAALISEIERLESRLEKYKNSPQQIYDEIKITLKSVQRLENEEAIANDVHTQRFKEILNVCILDIKGDVPEVQEVIEKRKKMRLTQLSEDEQNLLTSITEKVIPYIEEEQVKQDMTQDADAFKENHNASNFQEKIFKIYRWISRFSRILPLIIEKAQNFWKTVEPAVISKAIEVIASKIFGL